MGDWISAHEGFIAADVVRWTEGIYEKRRSKRAKARRIGERLISAEVIEDSDGWLTLLVRACVITQDLYAGTTIPILRIGDTIKRARRTVERGKPERLAWSDESVRDTVLETDWDDHTSAP